MLWVRVAIFGFLLFSPIIALIPQMRGVYFMAIELAMIFLIAWAKVEWEKRATVWYVCLYRGIIVNMPKTHQLMM